MVWKDGNRVRPEVEPGWGCDGVKRGKDVRLQDYPGPRILDFNSIKSRQNVFKTKDYFHFIYLAKPEGSVEED